jgi:hypothetical protein
MSSQRQTRLRELQERAEEQGRAVERLVDQATRGESSGLSGRDLVLLATMPIWLPIVVLAAVFAVVIGFPVVLFGPLYLLGLGLREGYGSDMAIGFGLVSMAVVVKLARLAATRKRSGARVLCPRCGSIGPENFCRVCNLQ